MKSAVNNSRFLLKSLHDNVPPEAFNSKPAIWQMLLMLAPKVRFESNLRPR